MPVQDLWVDLRRDKRNQLYRHRTPEEEIIETLAFIAEGVRISNLAWVKAYK